MNEWSQKRKRIILSMIFGILIILLGLPAFFFFYRAPTCFDGRKNGDETGEDCGGGCAKLCQADNLPIILEGDAQVIKVGSTTYAIAIQAENPNVNADILRAEYLFKVYEASSTVPVKLIDGETYVPKGSEFAVFAGPYDFLESIPSRVTFEWKNQSLIWNKNAGTIANLFVEDKALSQELTEPRLAAEIYNPSLEKITNLEFIAIISDSEGNMIGVSKTFIDSIDKDERQSIIFTWPQPFVGAPALIDILYKVLPDKSYL